MQRLLVLLLIAAATFSSLDLSAQSAADPQAIDLTSALRTIDSAKGNTDFMSLVETGDLNRDGSIDLLIGKRFTNDTGFTTTHQSLRLSPWHNEQRLNLYGALNWTLNMDGDDVRDVVSVGYSGADPTRVHWGQNTAPYYDSTRYSILSIGGETSLRPLATTDLTGDNAEDLLVQSYRKLFLFPSLTTKERPPVLVPTDSLLIEDSVYRHVNAVLVGRFRPGMEKDLLVAYTTMVGSDFTAHVELRLYRSNDPSKPLSERTPIVLYRDTVPETYMFVYTRPYSVGDISGDGLDDLIMSVGNKIYLYYGGPDFGSTMLTEENANAVLLAPSLLDSTSFVKRFNDQPIQFVGDLTGAGVPFLLMPAVVPKGQEFYSVNLLYAGGAALNSYYDARFGSAEMSDYNVSAIPAAVNGSGRTALLMFSGTSSDRYVRYLSEGTENIPHVQRSRVKPQPAEPHEQPVLLTTGRYKLPFTGEDILTLQGWDLLGREIDVHTDGESCISLSHLERGLYIIVVGSGERQVMYKLLN